MVQKREVIISLLFNVYWVLCVIFQNSMIFGIALIYILSIVYDRRALLPSLIIASIGIFSDLIYDKLGLYSFDAESYVIFGEMDSLVPVWLCFLWLGFGAYAWLLRDMINSYRGLLLALAFSVSGPLSYYSAYKLGAVNFPQGAVFTMIILFLSWFTYGFLFPFLVSLFTKVFNRATKHHGLSYGHGL